MGSRQWEAGIPGDALIAKLPLYLHEYPPNMLYLKSSSLHEILRELAVNLNFRFEETAFSARLILDNNACRGVCNTFELFEGLHLVTAEVFLQTPLAFVTDRIEGSPMFFSYVLNGSYEHAFSESEQPVEIGRFQNAIIKGDENKKYVFKFPANTKIRFSLLVVFFREVRLIANRKMVLRTAMTELFQNFQNLAPFRFVGPPITEPVPYANRIHAIDKSDIVSRLALSTAAIEQIKEQLHAYYQSTATDPPAFQSNLDQQVAEVANHISQNLDQKHKVSDLAKKGGVNQKKLQEGFRNLFGQSVNNFIASLRYEKARELLVTTDMNISEITHQIGINNQSYFSKSFNEFFGQTPTDYRKHFYEQHKVYHLSYVSRANPDLTSSDIREILRVAHQRNSKNYVTGSLLFLNGEFFQILEGPQKAVLKIFRSILADERHYNVETLWEGPKDKRVFTEWSMAYIWREDQQIDGTGSQPLHDFLDSCREKFDRRTDYKEYWKKIRNYLIIHGNTI